VPGRGGTPCVLDRQAVTSALRMARVAFDAHDVLVHLTRLAHAQVAGVAQIPRGAQHSKPLCITIVLVLYCNIFRIVLLEPFQLTFYAQTYLTVSEVSPILERQNVFQPPASERMMASATSSLPLRP